MKKDAYTAGPETISERLDTFISMKSGMTRSHIQKLIRDGRITVNAKTEKAGYHVREGDLIELTAPAEPDGVLVPEDVPLDILYEDKHIIVVNKPAGMVIYPALGNTRGTLMNALASKCDKLSSVGAPLRPGVIHRLDKDTSGAIVIAKDDMSYHGIIAQFKERRVEKHYLAVLFGRLKENKGEIRSLIGRSRWNRKKMSVKTDRGKEAVTQYEVIERFRSATLAKIRIVTGRTHQIRVHFASRGHPVLGDRTYGKRTELIIGQHTISFPRQMLHSYSLKLIHPLTGDEMEFIAPVPKDMKDAIEEIIRCSSV